MTILLQATTNSAAQLVQIIFNILAPHSQDQTKLFLDNVRVKRSKTKLNNKEVSMGI